MSQQSFPVDTAGNSSFSRLTPGMQLAIDSTSLGEFKTCPRKYYYSIIRGLQHRAESPHLRFGILLHQARENYDHAKSEGLQHDDALDRALDSALRDTWNTKLGRPWISEHNLKNRLTLVQTLVWYLDALGANDTFQTLQLTNGKPAVELSFRFDSGLRTSQGEVILLCGHIDRIGLLNEVPYILDLKTSGSAVDGKWVKQFSPGNQFSLYCLAGRVAFGVEVKDLVVDGAQIGVGFSRFQRHLVPRTEAQLAEWLDDTSVFVSQMETCAKTGNWPMNDKSCSMYGGCPFQSVCSRSPNAREQWLAADFVQRVWDPLQIRGDI